MLSDGDVLQRCIGRIKWFDPYKGYGFVDTADGDAMLYKTVLRMAGYQTARAGSTIDFDALRRPRGLLVHRVHSVDESTATDEYDPYNTLKMDVAPESDWVRANVKWFSRKKGYGFVNVRDCDYDLFVHMVTLRRFGFANLEPGTIVEVRYGHWKTKSGWLGAVAEMRSVLPRRDREATNG